MERKSSKEYSVVVLVEGEKFKLRLQFPLLSSQRRACPVLKHSRVSEDFEAVQFEARKKYINKYVLLNDLSARIHRTDPKNKYWRAIRNTFGLFEKH